MSKMNGQIAIQPMVLLLMIAFLSCDNKGYREFYADGTPKLICEDNNGGCEGNFVRYDEQGKITEKGFKRDHKLEGVRIWFKPNGDTASWGHYLNGKLEGTYFEYLDNGERVAASFTSNVQTGHTITYYPTGEVRIDEEVPNDTLTTKFIEYFKSGAVRFYALRRGHTTFLYDRMDSTGAILETYPKVITPSSPVPPPEASPR